MSAQNKELQARLSATEYVSGAARLDPLLNSTPNAKLDMLRSKSSPLYGEPATSLQDWALQACWSEEDQEEMEETGEENQADYTPEPIRAMMGKAKGAVSIDVSAQTLEHQDSVLLGESDADTPEHLRDVLSIGRSLGSPEGEVRPLFELSPQETQRSPGETDAERRSRSPKRSIRLNECKVKYEAI